MSNTDENKLTKLYKQEMDQLIKKLTKKKNVPTIETVTSLPSFKKNVKEKININVPLKIGKLDIKSPSKSKDIITTLTNNTNLLSNDQSKIPGFDTENIITVSAMNTINNNNITNIYDIKENNHIQKEMSEIITMINSCFKEENSKLLKQIFLLLKSSKFLKNVMNNDKIIDALNNLFKFYFLKYKFKVCDNELSLSKNVLLDELILNDDSNGLKIKNALWGDLITIYEIILLILNTDYETHKKLLRDDFLSKLFWNLKSLDSEERQITKLILYKIYSSSFNHRNLIINLIERILQDINYNSTSYKDVVSVNELFELMKSIISGLKKPIKLNIINLITRNIFPLLKSNHLKYFSTNYKNFINFLLNIDGNFVDNLIIYIIKSWPVRYPEKILLYLEIIENIILNYQIKNDKTNKKILRKIALCSKNTNFLVADKALILFRDEKIFKMFISENIVEYVIDCLVENVKSHWSNELKIISKLVISKYITTDKTINDKLNEETKKIIQSAQISNISEELWDILKFNVKAD